jgi:hypothetical protein
MNVREWLLSRTPAAPPALATRIIASLGERGATDARPVEACLDAAVDLLGQLLTEERLDRDDALDLLTVDALVTYAFEGAAEQVDGVEAVAVDAMLRLAALAESDDPTA